VTDVHLCGHDEVMGLYPPCPHADLDDEGFCLTCDCPVSLEGE